MLAVVERKTLDNLLADCGTMTVLHQRLAELAAQNNQALVIEAPYADFLSPKKVHHYNPSFCAKAIAELAEAVYGGCMKIGLAPYKDQQATSDDINLPTLLNEAWTVLLANPQGYTTWESKQVKRFREGVNEDS